MATWIIKDYGSPCPYIIAPEPGVLIGTHKQRLASRFSTRAAAREALSEIGESAASGAPDRSYRIVRLRTRDERTIAWLHQTVNDLSNQVESLSDRLNKLDLDFRRHDHDEDDFH